MKKNDFMLIAVILAVAGAVWLFHSFSSRQADYLTVSVDGAIVGEYPLSKDLEIPIGKGNICRIEDHKVFMASADCPDQICVHHTAIQADGETIICLPNKVTLTVHHTKQQSEVDTIVS
ncbi:MAG: NusG domain II-containing protein [Lachnospiraceae bacterium]|nr:NusG domain II-containing protein [Lachnospiraceae bacterium]